jgi:hypothetical protein
MEENATMLVHCDTIHVCLDDASMLFMSYILHYAQRYVVAIILVIRHA